jgi:hypothetical protein
VVILTVSRKNSLLPAIVIGLKPQEASTSSGKGATVSENDEISVDSLYVVV